MIHDPPLLTIRRDFQRPTAGEVAAFAGALTGHLVDAMGGRGALDHRIKPLASDGSVMVGVAVTSDNGPADNLGLFASLSVVQPGDILVAATDGFTATALAGDLILGMARNLGVAGFVTDGMVRDVAGILAVGLPVYCQGVTPNSGVRNGPGSVGQPVVLGGVAIESGDILVGDADGVVVVPRRSAAEVIARLAAVRTAEAALEAKVKAGLEIPDFIRAVLDSDRVREVS